MKELVFYEFQLLDSSYLLKSDGHLNGKLTENKGGTHVLVFLSPLLPFESLDTVLKKGKGNKEIIDLILNLLNLEISLTMLSPSRNNGQ